MNNIPQTCDILTQHSVRKSSFLLTHNWETLQLPTALIISSPRQPRELWESISCEYVHTMALFITHLDHLLTHITSL